MTRMSIAQSVVQNTAQNTAQNIAQNITQTAPSGQFAGAAPQSLLQRAAIQTESELPVETAPVSTLGGTPANHADFSHIPVSRSPVSCTPFPLVQPSLVVGTVGDRYEREADRVATAVTRQLQRPVAPGSIPPQPSAQTNLRPHLQLQGNSSDHGKTLTGLQPRSAPTAAPSGLEAALQQIRSRGGHPLASPLRSRMETSFGRDFSQVRVHTDARSDRLNQSLDAQAFTHRQDIFFRQGSYRPHAATGQRLIAHELTHVVQQAGGQTQSQNLLQPPVPAVPLVSRDPANKIACGGGVLASTSYLESVIGTQDFRAVRAVTGDQFIKLKMLSRPALDYLGTFNGDPNLVTTLTALAGVGTTQEIGWLLRGAEQAGATLAVISAMIIPNAAFLLGHPNHIPEALWALAHPAGDANAITNYLKNHRDSPQELALAKSTIQQFNYVVATATAVMQYLLPHLGQVAHLTLAQTVLAQVGNDVAVAGPEMAFLQSYLNQEDRVIQLAQAEYRKAGRDAVAAKTAMDNLAKYNYDPQLQEAVATHAETRAQRFLIRATADAAQTKADALAAADQAVKNVTDKPPLLPKSASNKDERHARQQHQRDIKTAEAKAAKAKADAEALEGQEIEWATAQAGIQKQRQIADAEQFIATHTPTVGADAVAKIVTDLESDIAGLTAGGETWLIQQTQAAPAILNDVLPFLTAHKTEKPEAIALLSKATPDTPIANLIQFAQAQIGLGRSLEEIIWAVERVTVDPARAAIALKLLPTFENKRSKLRNLLAQFTTDLNRLDQLVLTDLLGLSADQIATTLTRIGAGLDEANSATLVTRLLDGGNGLTPELIHELTKARDPVGIRFLDAASQGAGGGTTFPVVAKNLLTGKWKNLADMTTVLDTAQAKTTAVVPHNDLCRLLQLAQAHSYSSEAIDSCLKSNNLDSTHWNDFFTYEAEFRNAGNNGYKDLSPDDTGGAVTVIETFDRPAPPAPATHQVRMITTANRVKHYCNGHTFEHFKFTYENCTRALTSSFWAVGQTQDSVKGYATALAGNAAVRATADTQARTGWAPATVGGYRMGFTRESLVGTLYTARLDQFYPDAAPGIQVGQWVLCAIGSLLRKTPFAP